MKLQTLIIASCLGLSQLQGWTQITVDFMAGPGQRDVVLDANMPVPDGNYVSIGYFDFGFDPAANVDNVTTLYDSWNEFGSTSIQSIFGQPGRFSGSQSSTAAQFNNQNIFLWVFKTMDNARPADDFSNLEGFGLFTGSASQWRFPAQGQLPPNNMATVTSSDVSQALFGSFDGQHLYLAPASVVVPEPSTWALLAAGAGSFWFFLRKRDRKDA